MNSLGTFKPVISKSKTPPPKSHKIQQFHVLGPPLNIHKLPWHIQTRHYPSREHVISQANTRSQKLHFHFLRAKVSSLSGSTPELSRYRSRSMTSNNHSTQVPSRPTAPDYTRSPNPPSSTPAKALQCPSPHHPVSCHRPHHRPSPHHPYHPSSSHASPSSSSPTPQSP